MEQKYWLAENGTVRCLDDRCPQECDLECPIYLQTMAIPYLQNNHFEEAASYLKKAVKIEPTFAEAWNNLAMCYGQMGDHQQAYEYYKKSFDLVEKPNSLFGMAVAMKNVGKLANAMQYVKMYERRYGKDERINSLTAEISEKEMERQVSGNTPPKGSTPANRTVSRDQGSAGKDNSENAEIMREYGRQYLKLLDEETRESGYAELEKLESRFPEAGIVVGQYYLGIDEEEAIKHFKVAADAGIAEGLWSYSQLLPHSYVLDLSDPEDQLYLKYCLAAAEGGNADAANEMGNICHRKESYDESTYWYGMAYSMEHRDGIASLRGITKEWQQKGLNGNHSMHIGNFTEDRRKTSLILFKMFNQRLEKEDLDELMGLTLQGENLAGFIEAKIMEQHNQYDMAYKVYNALAFENHPYALRCYADMNLAGKGVQRNLEGAFRMYKLAAEKGDATAMFAMGQKAFKEGDYLMAACWFGMAYTRGMEQAADWLTRLNK